MSHITMHDLGRKPSLLQSNRLSLALTSRLSSFLETTSAKAICAATPYPSTPHKVTKAPRTSSGPLSLQEDFDSFLSAEPPTDPYLIKEHEYPSIRALRTDEEIGDGLWLCSHCRHENILRHYKGTFPFKHLRCLRCHHILCSHCHTSAILSPIPFGLIHARPLLLGREIRYCHMCPTCGLSHRAEQEGTTLDFYATKCADCGLSSWGDWPRYHIGDHEPYRRDPDVIFAELVDRRAEDASRLAFRWVVANEVDSKLVSRLSDAELGKASEEAEVEVEVEVERYMQVEENGHVELDGHVGEDTKMEVEGSDTGNERK